MATIDELKREIAREKSYAESEAEIQKIGDEKKSLQKQLKSMKFKRKFGKFVPKVDVKAIKKIGTGIKSGIQRLNSEVGKVRDRQDIMDRQNRSISKRKTKQKPQPQRVGLFG